MYKVSDLTVVVFRDLIVVVVWDLTVVLVWWLEGYFFFYFLHINSCWTDYGFIKIRSRFAEPLQTRIF
jgi:hypothetical protein